MKLLCPQRNRQSTLSPSENETANESQGMDENTDVPSELQELDSLGMYQVMLYLLISIPLCLTAGFSLSYVFTAGEVSYRCLVPECEEASNATLNPPWVHYSAPYKNGKLATCTRYVVTNSSETCSKQSFSNETQSCDVWVFDPDENTILKEWQLTCESNQWKLTLVGTLNNIGQFIGLTFSGYVSDKFGRRTYLTVATFLSGIAGLIHSFSVNYWMFLIFEVFGATFAAGIYSAGFILGMEIVGPRRRALGSTVLSSIYALGEILLGLFAMWLKSWQAILWVVYAPALLAIFLPLMIPESIRWLLTQGKIDEAEKVYRQMARMNKIQVSEETIRTFTELNTEKSEKVNDEVVEKSPVVQVLNSPVILVRVLICSFCWLANTFVYYGLSLNSVAFTGDKYLTFILVVVVEIPAYFIAWIFSDYLGRKRTLCGSLLLSGMFCLVIQFVPSGAWTHLPLILYMCGKCCITIAFTVVYTCSAEIFPTSLRHSLIGFCSMIGRVGSMLAPQTPLLANIMDSLPLILFGSVGIIAGLSSLNLPETLGMKLPDTVYEAEHIGKAVLKKDSNNSLS